jgi:anti-sigma regulatory factor (Ser/Thr protein kinase)
MQKAVALAHLRVAYEPDDDDEDVVALPALPASPPQLLPVTSAWWETPAVTSRVLTAEPEEARASRIFVRDLLTRWGLADLVEDAELIIGELVVNAVRHGLRAVPPVAAVSPSAPPPMRLCLLRRSGEVMLAVTDPSAEPPTPRAPEAARESGRGLQIVGALSYVWGWSPIEGHGKAVWAVLKYSALPRVHANPGLVGVGLGQDVLHQGDEDFLGRLAAAGVTQDDRQARL